VPDSNGARARGSRNLVTDIPVRCTEMSVLDLIEACGRARTVAGLEHALSEHLGSAVELTREGGSGIALRDGAWRCRTRTRAYPAEPLRRLLDGAVEHMEVLARVAELNRSTTRDRDSLRDEVQRIVLPAGLVAASPELRRIFHELVPLVARTDTTVLIRG